MEVKLDHKTYTVTKNQSDDFKCKICEKEFRAKDKVCAYCIFTLNHNYYLKEKKDVK